MDIYKNEFEQFLFLKKNKDTIKTIPEIHKAAKKCHVHF